jgi:PAS domain S-box-containing protein
MVPKENRLGAGQSRALAAQTQPAGEAQPPAAAPDFARRIMETAQVIIEVVDLKGRIVQFNPFMEEVSGYLQEEIRGREWLTTLVPEHERQRMKALFTRCIQGQGAGPFTAMMLTRNGGLRAIDWRVTRLTRPDGVLTGLLFIGKDITQRLQAERELYELNKVSQQRERLADVGAIAAQIVHDVGNPLAALSMQAQVIRRRAREYPDQPVGSVLKSAEQMVVELRRLESLIREFMNFAREQRLQLRRIDLPRFLSGVRNLWQQVALARGINLTSDVPDPQLRVRADEEKLHRVLDNLVKNAVEAIGDGPGNIVISAAAVSESKVRISVADNGPGIPGNLEVFRLFESTKADGSGLGLAVARQIVLAHGGSIYFEAVRPRGTLFHVELPLEGPAAEETGAVTPGATGS